MRTVRTVQTGCQGNSEAPGEDARVPARVVRDQRDADLGGDVATDTRHLREREPRDRVAGVVVGEVAAPAASQVATVGLLDDADALDSLGVAVAELERVDAPA